jgi:hypothetical protein
MPAGYSVALPDDGVSVGETCFVRTQKSVTGSIWDRPAQNF